MGEPAAPCSCRHESGHAKTWRKPQAQECDREDAVSVDPASPRRANANAKPKTKSKDIRIIQLQKKNLLLRTELDVLRCELHALKTEVGGLVQQHKEQEAVTKRANQCMQDWANKQVIERVWILETQHAQLRSEHLKQKEQQQQPQPCEKVKLSKKSKKELKKLSKRLELLENMNNNNNKRPDYECNKCNNPFDFKAIYEHYDQHHYLNANANADVGMNACPALDLIANHYADLVPPSSSSSSSSVPSAPLPSVIESLNDADECTDDDDDDDDDDLFQLIQIEVVSDFSLPK
jgi:hypothetical protein